MTFKHILTLSCCLSTSFGILVALMLTSRGVSDNMPFTEMNKKRIGRKRVRVRRVFILFS